MNNNIGYIYHKAALEIATQGEAKSFLLQVIKYCRISYPKPTKNILRGQSLGSSREKAV